MVDLNNNKQKQANQNYSNFKDLANSTTMEAKETANGAEEEEQQQQNNDHRQNLDSGYAWLILLVMFLLQSSISGSSRVYGIVYAKEVAIGYYDREQASWPIATASAVENLAGILTPALAQCLSWRSIELMSTGLFIVANLLAYFSSSLVLDIIALGLIQGLALSTCTVLSLAINNDFFERYRTTAYGISMSGSTFGVLYLSPLVTWLLEKYGDDFRVVYLALAGVFLCNIALVLFIKPRSQTIKVTHARGGANVGRDPHEEEDEQRAKRPREATNPLKSISSRLTAAQNYNLTAMNSCSVREIEAGATTAKAPLGSGVRSSRFESHFERKDSIASISYRAKSRRQSILSRLAVGGEGGGGGQVPVFATLSSQAMAAVAFEQQPETRLQTQQGLPKSRSGADLSWHEAQKMKKISLSSMRSPVPVQPQEDLGVEQVSEQPNGPQTSRETSQLASFYLQHAPITPRLSSSSGCHLPGEEPESELELDVASLYRRLAQEHEQLAHGLALSIADKKPHHQFDDDRKLQMSSPQRKQADEFSLELMGKLLKLPYLHCTWIMLALYYLVARIFVIILVDFANDHGFSLNESTSLLNYWSLGELVGRVLLGSLIDLQFLSCKSCVSLVCSMLASLILCMILVESYLVYAVCSMLIAALISLEYMLINVMMVEYLGKHMVTNCYSLAACLASAVLFARPSMIGLFRDHLGSYDGLLLLLAALAFLFSVGFYLLEPWLVRHWPKSPSGSFVR